MCCLYYYDQYSVKEAERLAREGDASLFKGGEIRPNDPAPVLAKKGEDLKLLPMRFGFALPEKKLVINARQETVLSKRMFSESVLKRRCAIPASKFYEWDPWKERVTFRAENRESFFFAGIYDLSGGEERFVILTTAADSVMSPVHDRMPLLLKAEQAKDWIRDLGCLSPFLKGTFVPLTSEREYTQLSLF